MTGTEQYRASDRQNPCPVELVSGGMNILVTYSDTITELHISGLIYFLRTPTTSDFPGYSTDSYS